MMNFEEYQTKALEFLNIESANEEYLFLGLIGEIGEVAEKLKKIIRDKNRIISFEDKEEIKKELGDVFWYFAILCYSRNVKVNFSNILNNEYLNCNFGEIMYEISDAANYFLYYHNFSYFYEVFNRLCLKLEFSLQDVLYCNIRKLSDRQLRGKIKGEGDNR